MRDTPLNASIFLDVKLIGFLNSKSSVI